MDVPIEPVEKTYKCPWCDVVKTLRGLCCHAGRVHRRPSYEVHQNVLHDGKVPCCGCGCGQPTHWLQKRYGDYLRGHNGFSENKTMKKDKTAITPSNSLVPTPLVDGHKPSIAALSGQAVVCSNCERPFAAHVKTDQCPACGERTIAARVSFASFLGSLGLEMTKPIDGSWRVGGYAFFLDSPWQHSLPGPLRNRSQVEKETTTLLATGVDVVRFYEDEWLDRNDVCRSIVEHALGRSATRVGARECDLVELSADERRAFLSRCHLEGDVRCMISFGLKKRSDQALVAVLSAREPFHRSVHAGKLEIARFACELGTAVPGGLSRLVKRLFDWAREHGYASVLSYADGRLGDGDAYTKVGFTRAKRGSPRLWWTDYRRRFNRFKVRADSAAGITQNQRAVQEGVVELWGCGNVAFEHSLLRHEGEQAS